MSISLFCSAWVLLFVGFFKHRTAGGVTRAFITQHLAHFLPQPALSDKNVPFTSGTGARGNLSNEKLKWQQKKAELGSAKESSGEGKKKGKKGKKKKARQECSDRDLFSCTAFQLK